MTTSDDDKKKKQKRSRFSEADDLAKRLEAARKKADFDRENSLSIDNTTADELVYTLLTKALQQEFEKTDKLQGGSFIHGSMQRLHSGMWKGALKK